MEACRRLDGGGVTQISLVTAVVVISSSQKPFGKCKVNAKIGIKAKVVSNDEIIVKEKIQWSAELSNGARPCNWVLSAEANIWSYEPREQQSSFEMLSLHGPDVPGIGIPSANLTTGCNQGHIPQLQEKGPGRGGHIPQLQEKGSGRGGHIPQLQGGDAEQEKAASKKTAHFRLAGG